VKNKRERSSLVRHPGVEKTSRLGSRDLVANGVKCGLHGGKNSGTKSWTVSWLSLKTKVAGTTWESSHEWRLAEDTPSSWGLQWFTRKPLGYLVEPQNRGRRLDEEVWPPRPVQPPRRGGLTAWVTAAEKLRSGGHGSGSQGLRRG
jgi:hypothetical protein